MLLPIHSTSLGSGSHSPVPMHVEDSGPISISPGGQRNMREAPSNAGLVEPITLTGLVLLSSSGGLLHDAIIKNYSDHSCVKHYMLASA